MKFPTLFTTNVAKLCDLEKEKHECTVVHMILDYHGGLARSIDLNSVGIVDDFVLYKLLFLKIANEGMVIRLRSLTCSFISSIS